LNFVLNTVDLKNTEIPKVPEPQRKNHFQKTPDFGSIYEEITECILRVLDTI